MNEKWEFNSEDIQRVVDRLARARWISLAGVHGFDFELHFSALGHSRMERFALLFWAAAPPLFGIPGKKAFLLSWKTVALLWEFVRARFELKPALWRKGERSVFIGLVMLYAQSPESFREKPLRLRSKMNFPPGRL